MISLRDSQIIDILPDILKYRPDIQAFSYAIHIQIAKLCDLAEKCKVYAGIDELSEDVLDLMAIELQSIYYDTDLPIDKKRAVIKATLRWHWYGGTKASVEDYVRTIFGGGSVIEWFEYGGSPYHFKIDAEDTGNTMQIGKVIDTIYKIKRPDTSFETYIGEPVTIRIGTSEEGWIVYHAPAGTLPDESTRLSMDPSVIDAITLQKGYKAPWEEPGETTTGKSPDQSTQASIDTTAAGIKAEEAGYQTTSEGGEKLVASLNSYTVQYQTCGSQVSL